MSLNLDEVESSPVQRSGGRGLLWLVIGIVFGVAGTLILPRYITPFLPEALRGGGEQVDGVVLDMRRDGDNLLLTVDTQKGAVLATFTRRIPEVELLVGVGDTLTLKLDAYDPFVGDPPIAAVRKSRAGPDAEWSAGGDDAGEPDAAGHIPGDGEEPSGDAAAPDTTPGAADAAADTAAVGQSPDLDDGPGADSGVSAD